MIKKFKNKLIVFCFCAIASTGSFASDDPIILKVSTWAGPNHPINTEVLQDWKTEIEIATNGTVKLEFYHDLAPPKSQIRLVNSGAADIGWIYHGHIPENFILHRLLEMPFADSSASGKISRAHWLTFKKFFESYDEHQGAKLLAVGVHGPGQILSKSPIKSLDDLKGKSVRVGSKIMENLALQLGMNPVYLPTPQIYESGKQGVIDATFIPVETLSSFNLSDVFTHVYRFPHGLYSGSFSIFINPDSWDNLSRKQQKQIMSVSGESLSYKFGNVMHQADKIGIEHGLSKGITIIEAQEDDVSLIRKILSNELNERKTEVKKAYDLNPDTILKYFRSESDET